MKDTVLLHGGPLWQSCQLPDGRANEDLIDLLCALGQWIRSRPGLWRHTLDLVTATGRAGAVDASEVLIPVFWVALRGEHPEVHG